MQYIYKPIYKYLTLLFIIFLFILNQEILTSSIDIFIISFCIIFIVYLCDMCFIEYNIGLYDEPNAMYNNYDNYYNDNIGELVNW
jgi:hypothetical protein